ncbi:SMP-30/gluconolactonase/LRE family protein [Paraburkholderia domus]|uniref:Gluconolactonase n=1 Tax=Paraburkholderia domus TaxID=2793075 RepID=A0A9N8R5T9_9BURK|nr:SMP-30/gluconolactonase/LRE family protein [Paraburkholderia domus]MBK5054388.1 SMP-30/gluconolactonase/LRE family protein [Burkholderia sp. R-70006]MBK5066226.1 SMP-30/gluconolactonase/LRE family protein [Burkholderia sp. R-70199]MBK5169751.1 SMP-30/gluconolactonase/LRE family protein [Burkholderia sp. R-70211]MBK5185453.1 SMP-30/gluconolactonase/LRE family protein [Burkholderia sp. R-69749]CAE6860053.1 Gluconolactonase [Paraburkholderia domus]
MHNHAFSSSGQSEVRVIADDLQFPEGPVWLGDGSLLVVEIRRQTLTRVWLDGRKKIVADLKGGPNGAAIGPDGRCYVTNNGGVHFVQREDGCWASGGVPTDYVGGSVQRVDIETGEVEVLYRKINGRHLLAPNDLVFDGCGGFWFTDAGKSRQRDGDHGSVYYAKADGSFIEEAIFPIHKPNGVGISGTGRTLYVAETDTARLWAWDINRPGELASSLDSSSPSPHGGRFLCGFPQYARFDSLAVDPSGNICVATLDRGGITVCSPTGGFVGFVPVPGDTHLTNLCFASELGKVYATQSYAGRLVALDWPPSFMI